MRFPFRVIHGRQIQTYPSRWGWFMAGVSMGAEITAPCTPENSSATFRLSRNGSWLDEVARTRPCPYNGREGPPHGGVN